MTEQRALRLGSYEGQRKVEHHHQSTAKLENTGRARTVSITFGDAGDALGASVGSIC